MIACPKMAPVSPSREHAPMAGLTRGAGRVLAAAGAILLLCACASRVPQASGARVSAQTETDGVRLLEGDRQVLYYRRRAQPGREAWRLHYVHPLHSVGGEIITEDGPADHVHHRGLFWAWRRILVDGVRVADGWVGQGLDLDVAEPTVSELPDGSAQIDVRVVWRVPLDGRATAIIEESSRIRAYPVSHGRRRVEVEVRLRGLRSGVEIGGTEDEKGYGGPSLRFGNSERIVIHGDGRELRATPAAIEVGDAIDFSWPSLPAPWPERVRVACEVDGRPWTRWVLRQEPSMQNCAFPGARSVRVPVGDELRLRLVIDLG